MNKVIPAEQPLRTTDAEGVTTVAYRSGLWFYVLDCTYCPHPGQTQHRDLAVAGICAYHESYFGYGVGTAG